MEKLSLDEWGNIVKYLEIFDFLKLKCHFSEKDFTHLRQIRCKSQNEGFKAVNCMTYISSEVANMFQIKPKWTRRKNKLHDQKTKREVS